MVGAGRWCLVPQDRKVQLLYAAHLGRVIFQGLSNATVSIDIEVAYIFCLSRFCFHLFCKMILRLTWGTEEALLSTPAHGMLRTAAGEISSTVSTGVDNKSSSTGELSTNPYGMCVCVCACVCVRPCARMSVCTTARMCVGWGCGCVLVRSNCPAGDPKLHVKETHEAIAFGLAVFSFKRPSRLQATGPWVIKLGCLKQSLGCMLGLSLAGHPQARLQPVACI
jgi:hypothetical protein